MSRPPYALAIALLAACASDSSTASTDAQVAPAASPHETGLCGSTPLPDCPLQRWMKENARDALAAEDYSRLERAFVRIESLSRPDFPEWGLVARAGARAARATDLERVRSACQRCHSAYRAAYRRDYRDLELAPVLKPSR